MSDDADAGAGMSDDADAGAGMSDDADAGAGMSDDADAGAGMSDDADAGAGMSDDADAGAGMSDDADAGAGMSDGRSGTSDVAPRTASNKARSRSGSLCPGAASVPLAVSIANGRARCPCSLAARIASTAFSGPRPPLRISGTLERRAASKLQSNVSPVPPRSPSLPGVAERASSR